MLDSYAYKTLPRDHQWTALQRSWEEEAFALLMEQGTGKTKVILDNAALLYNLGRINALVVFAPNGVHRNWIRKELAAHLPDYIPVRTAWWASSPNKAEKQAMEALWKPGPELKVFCLNMECLALDRAVKEVEKFLRATNAMLVIDESQRIKSIQAMMTKNALKLRKLAKYRRILTGTFIANSPLDAFSQLMFLDPSILPTQSFTAFRARYAEIMSQDHPMIKAIARKAGKAYEPVMVATDENGKPIYKNLEELRRIVQAISFRVLKKDCLDLPPKVHTRHPVEMDAEQKKWYKKLVERVKLGVQSADDFVKPINKVNVVMYAQQILCGIIPAPLDEHGQKFIYDDPRKNPRVKAVLEEIDGSDEKEQHLIWCRFTHDITTLVTALELKYGQGCALPFYGDVNDDDRMVAEDRFQRGEVRFLVLNSAAGGTGYTFTAASQSHYYSNSFKLIDRLQSEDRNHRDGSQHHDAIRYVDYEVEGSVDTKILQAFLDKKDVADAVTGDELTDWIKL